MRQKALHPLHPDIGQSVSNLGILYQSQGRLAEAEAMFLQAVLLFEKALAPDHPETATGLTNLGQVYQAQGRFMDGEEAIPVLTS